VITIDFPTPESEATFLAWLRDNPDWTMKVDEDFYNEYEPKINGSAVTFESSDKRRERQLDNIRVALLRKGFNDATMLAEQILENYDVIGEGDFVEERWLERALEHEKRSFRMPFTHAVGVLWRKTTAPHRIAQAVDTLAEYLAESLGMAHPTSSMIAWVRAGTYTGEETLDGIVKAWNARRS
jgi:hypothetical protein